MNSYNYVCIKCKLLFKLDGIDNRTWICHQCTRIDARAEILGPCAPKQPINKAAKLDPATSKKGKLKLASPALHPEMISLLAEVAELSIEKGYEPLNWLKEDSAVTVSYCLNAGDRHRQKAKLGFDRNTEEKHLDGTPTEIQPLHLAQSAYNDLMAALLILKKGNKADDRMFKNGELK